MRPPDTQVDNGAAVLVDGTRRRGEV